MRIVTHLCPFYPVATIHTAHSYQFYSFIFLFFQCLFMQIQTSINVYRIPSPSFLHKRWHTIHTVIHVAFFTWYILQVLAYQSIRKFPLHRKSCSMTWNCWELRNRYIMWMCNSLFNDCNTLLMDVQGIFSPLVLQMVPWWIDISYVCRYFYRINSKNHIYNFGRYCQNFPP